MGGATSKVNLDVGVGAHLKPGDSNAPLADVREGRTVLRRQALRNERHVVEGGVCNATV